MFLASADWMNRNLYRRVEVGFPVYDAQARSEIRQIIEFQLNDNVKACTLDDTQTNHPVPSAGKPAVRAQTDTYEWLKNKEDSTALPLASTITK
jgi:polyphosphate kinase